MFSASSCICWSSTAQYYRILPIRRLNSRKAEATVLVTEHDTKRYHTLLVNAPTVFHLISNPLRVPARPSVLSWLVQCFYHDFDLSATTSPYPHACYEGPSTSSEVVLLAIQSARSILAVTLPRYPVLRIGTC